jgi:hypothetical protein
MEVQIEPKIKKTIDNFLQQLKGGLGDNLKSLALYGSLAGGEYSSRKSDINLLVILEKADLASLKSISRIKRKAQFKTIEPLVFSQDYLESSTDVFPIEFLDLKARNILLFGKDVLNSLKIDLANLRHQCEWELKSKIVRLQKFYIDSGGKEKPLGQFLLNNFSSFITVFKSILRLQDIIESKKEKIIQRLVLEFGLNKEVFDRLLSAGRGEARLTNPGERFDEFYLELLKLSTCVDRLAVK